MARKTTGTWWVFPKDALTAFRATMEVTGLFVMEDGTTPPFDPETAVYMTSDMVGNLAPSTNTTIFGGDTASARKLLKGKHAWKSAFDFDGIFTHAWLSRTMPGKETVVAAYKALNAASEVEI